MMDERNHDAGTGGCTACTGRREFLREAAGLAAALLVGLGASPARAQRMAMAAGRPTAIRDGELAYPVPAADGATIDRDREVIVVRWRSRAYAFALSCPHQHTMLRWQPADARFQCPKHRSRYQPDGTFVSGRATRGMDRFPVRVHDGEILVDVARPIRQDHDRAAWDAAVAAL
jgi:nitrite reductase/ring-hydroxylating ferredoxin subunit